MSKLGCSKCHKQTTGGFSLVEIIVVMAILFIMASMTVVGFANYAKTQQYVRFVDEVGHQVRLAKQQTLAAKDDSQYGIYFGTSTIELFAGSVPDVGSSSNQILEFGRASYTATSSLSNGSWYVTFARITGEASATGTILITDTELGRTATYIIRTSGLIE